MSSSFPAITAFAKSIVPNKIINTNEIQNYTGVGTINGAELAMNMFTHTQELNVEFDYAKANVSWSNIGAPWNLYVTTKNGNKVDNKCV